MINRKILLVDDEERLLSSIKRNLHNFVDLHLLSDPTEVVSYIRANGPFAVIISDYQMPKVNGIELLQMVQKISPTTVRVMLTGQADLDVSIGSINKGKIFRFLTKPCGIDDLKASIVDAIRQYELVIAEKELLQETLRGGIKVITDILSILNPMSFGKSNLVREHVKDLNKEMVIDHFWQLDLAASIYLIGFILMPDQIITKKSQSEPLSPDEEAMLNSYTTLSSQVISNIPRLDKIGRIIENVNYYELSKEIGQHSRILRIVNDFVDLTNKLNPIDAVAHMASMPNIYDKDILKKFEAVASSKAKYVNQKLYINDLKTGMVLNEDVMTIDGLLLIKKNHVLNESSLLRLNNYGSTCGVKEPIRVMVRNTKQG